MERRVPEGIVTPLENVNGRNTSRVMITGEKEGIYEWFVIGTM